eukprot:1161772-Pelagomonas_calceolata.AAC.10
MKPQQYYQRAQPGAALGLSFDASTCNIWWHKVSAVLPKGKAWGCFVPKQVAGCINAMVMCTNLAANIIRLQ